MSLLINFPQYGKMKKNLWYGESLRNWYLYYSYSMCAFSPIRLSFYGILYHMENACVFSSNFHNMGKDSQTHRMVRPGKLFPSNILQKPSNVDNLENFYSYFSHSMQNLSHQIPILWYASSHGKCMGLLIKFSITLEKSAKPIEWGRPGKLVVILFP